MGTGHFCTSDSFARASLLHEGILLHGDSFARRVTFARGEIFIRRNLCITSLLARCCNSMRHFCKISFMHGVIFLQKFLCTAKFINNQNGASLLHAFLNNLIK